MSEIKILKIDSSGFQSEHDSSVDDIVFNNIEAGNQISITSGPVLDSNSLVFQNETDTIGTNDTGGTQIQIQNLLDKTGDETITGTFTFSTTPQLTGSIVNDNDIVNKAYADGLIGGLDWQESVSSILDAAPVSPTTGDRYIVGTPVTGDDWFGQDEKIAEWDGSQWVFTTPNEGFATWIENVDEHRVYNNAYPTGSWIKFAAVTSHNSLSGLQGGNGSDEYYHMTSSEDTWLNAAITKVPTGSNLADITGNETITGDWTFNGLVDITNGQMIFPDSAETGAVDGQVYWDGTADTLYVSNGTSYVAINSAATEEAETLVETDLVAGSNIGQYDVVYISGNDTIDPAQANSISTTAATIGIASEAINTGLTGKVVRNGILTGAINGLGATAGDPIYLSATVAGGLSTSPAASGGGRNVLRIGWAANTTDILVDIGEITRRA